MVNVRDFVRFLPWIFSLLAMSSAKYDFVHKPFQCMIVAEDSDKGVYQNKFWLSAESLDGRSPQKSLVFNKPEAPGFNPVSLCVEQEATAGQTVWRLVLDKNTKKPVFPIYDKRSSSYVLRTDSQAKGSPENLWIIEVLNERGMFNIVSKAGNKYSEMSQNPYAKSRVSQSVCLITTDRESYVLSAGQGPNQIRTGMTCCSTDLLSSNDPMFSNCRRHLQF